MASTAINTKIIKDLCFSIFGDLAIRIVVDYVEKNSGKASIIQQVRPIANFLMYLKLKHDGSIDKDIVVEYIRVIIEKHSFSTAANIAGFLRGFLDFLYSLGYIQDRYFFSFNRVFSDTKIKEAKDITDDEPGTEDFDEKHDINECAKEHSLVDTYDYYSILNIPYTATKEEIKKAYHLRAMDIHPDRNSDDVFASIRFCTLNTIYRILMKDSERFAYDITMGYRTSKLKVNRTKEEYKVSI